VRTTLADFGETEIFQNAGNFARFQNRNISHKIRT
jgi:hypothetical protein